MRDSQNLRGRKRSHSERETIMGGAAGTSLLLLLGITAMLATLHSGAAFKLVHMDQGYPASQDSSSSRWRAGADGGLGPCSWACEAQAELSRDECLAACVLLEQQQQQEQQAVSSSLQIHHGKTSASRRQADELLSCIEANCASRLNYQQCIFNQCIVRSNLGYLFKSRRGFSAGGMQGAATFQQETSLRDSPEGDDDDDAVMSKRGWDDPVDSCIAYYCAGRETGTLPYQLCLAQWCRGRR